MTNKKNIIKISEIDRMIMEEITRLKKIDEITSRLAVVSEELNRLKEEEGIEEVSVGGTRNGDEWYEKGVPVAKFEKKGSHLKEEEPIDAAEELPSDDIGADMGDETIEVGDDMGVGAPETFEEKLAAVGRELDMKLAGAGAMGDTSDDMLDTPAEEVPADDASAEEPEAEETSDDDKEDLDEIEIDEVDATVAEMEETEECDTTMEESKEEAAPINESVDRLGRKSNPILEKELKRAQYLAGLSDEE